MKILLALVLSLGAFTVSAFDSKPTATEKLASYLPVGFYFGKTDQGLDCKVTVAAVNYPKKDLQVRVVAGNLDLTKLVEEGSEFYFKDFKKEFIQTERSLIGADASNYVERVVRTTIVSDYQRYVVVAYSVIINRERESKVAECVIYI